MTFSGDEFYEMRSDRFLDDETAEALLSGRVLPGREELAELRALLSEARSIDTTPTPMAGARLAAILAGGLSTDKGDLPATAASNVTGPAPQAAALPKRRKTVLETILAKAVLAKAAAVLGGLTIATTGAAAAGVLPDVAQDKVGTAIERVLQDRVDIPTSADAAKAKRAEGERVAGEHKADEADAQGGNAGDHDDFGTTVSGRASSGEPQADGRAFGESVRSTAPGATQAGERRPATTPTAESNPGTSYRESAPSGQPATTPTAESNPGTSYRESAPSGQPESTPTAESNPGTSYRESAPSGQPESTPTAESNPGTSYRESAPRR